MEHVLVLSGWHVAEVAVQADAVVPVYPAQGGELDVLDAPPQSLACWSADQLGLVVAVDGLGQDAVEVPYFVGVPPSATVPIDGCAPISARRSPYLSDVNCDPASEWHRSPLSHVPRDQRASSITSRTMSVRR